MTLEAFLASQTARRFFDDLSKLAHAVHLFVQQLPKHELNEYRHELPRYKHYQEPHSAFLGQWQKYDLYYQPFPNGMDAYVARYGDEEGQYYSSMNEMKSTALLALRLAKFIVTELNLSQPRTRKMIITGE